LIATVTPGTPAAEAGLRPGDRVVVVAGRPVTGAAMLQGLIEAAPIGENLTITIERGGKRQDLVVRPQAQPAGGTGVPIMGTRVLPDTRQGQPGGKGSSQQAQPVPRGAPRLPSSSLGDDVPSALDPIPPADAPADRPSLESPKSQPAESPR
jgi:membrane-associated protease RseP (regulator of RpoE activity)